MITCNFQLRRNVFVLLFTMGMCVLPRAPADHYVATNGNHAYPYDAWTKAATNIQAAITAAVAGATVWISNGTYTASASSAGFVYITNSLNLRGFSGRPADVIINGNSPAYTNRGIYVALTNTAYVLIDALTISNCFAIGSGGGILIKITNAVSGVAVSGTAVVQNCIITDNKCSRSSTTFRGWGAGICSFGQIDSGFYTVISNCTIANNITTNSGFGNAGGGALFYMSRFTMQDCRITGNKTTYDGGGGVSVFQDLQTILGSVIRNCMIDSNIAEAAFGGGIRVSCGTLVENCTLRYNSAASGAGVSLDGGPTNTLRNCLVYYNTATSRGGGIYLPASCTNLIENCTIVSNVNASTENGVGVNLIFAGCQLDMRNTIVYYNYKTNGTLDYIYNKVYIRSSTSSCTTPTNGMAGSGDITNEPAFVDFAGRDYRLAMNSPCVNTGSNAAWMTGARDLDNHTRIDPFSSRVDRGCYEYLFRGMTFKTY